MKYTTPVVVIEKYDADDVIRTSGSSQASSEERPPELPEMPP